ncbi:MAG: hypothetical protein AB8F74_01105 [Saprospiraceae bacterium]
MVQSQVVQKINLIEGEFSPSEASDLIGALIREKINFHKIQRLGQLIHDDCCDQAESRARIKELEEERKVAKEFISKARINGKKVTISGTLKITYDE